MEIGNYIASGGVSGVIMAGLYVAYKCCYRKKFKSSCCGASMDISADPNVQLEEEKSASASAAAPTSRPASVVLQMVPPPTPSATPSATPTQTQIQPTKQPSELVL
jgi:cytoskeletal protein RodZ